MCRKLQSSSVQKKALTSYSTYSFALGENKVDIL
uniref:Uncharacterized protein n=1 Tax=Arundo donax TaxID=35708 RepID=A0A0A8ZAH1_ARUDO